MGTLTSTLISSHGLALIPRTTICEDHQIEIVCEGANIQDWNSHGLPKNIEILRINSTHLTRFPANAFQNLTITKLIVENNPFLQEIDENAFEQVFGLEYIEIRKNTALDIPTLFAPFRNLQALQSLILEKNFIRAEAVSCDDFIKYGSTEKCKENGKLRIEGKDYIVKDGDVLYFRVNS